MYGAEEVLAKVWVVMFACIRTRMTIFFQMMLMMKSSITEAERSFFRSSRFTNNKFLIGWTFTEAEETDMTMEEVEFARRYHMATFKKHLAHFIATLLEAVLRTGRSMGRPFIAGAKVRVASSDDVIHLVAHACFMAMRNPLWCGAFWRQPFFCDWVLSDILVTYRDASDTYNFSPLDDLLPDSIATPERFANVLRTPSYERTRNTFPLILDETTFCRSYLHFDIR